jgi:putative transposase
MILLMADGASNWKLARDMRLGGETPRRWRARWLSWAAKIQAVEEVNSDDKALTKVICEALNDRPRSGAPGKFTPEQIVRIVAVACEKPEESNRPISHWTPREVADEVMKRGIVRSISKRQCGRFLKSGGFKATSSGVLVKRKT